MKIPLLISFFVVPVFLIPSCRRVAPENEDRSEQKAAVEQLDMERWQLARERAALQEELAEFDRQLEAAENATDARSSELELQKKALEERSAELEAREKALAEGESALQEEPQATAEEADGPVVVGEPVHDFIEAPDLEWDAGDLPAVADYGMFYEDLAPHGDWFETSDYGYIWRPTVVVQVNNWRPYCDGRWVWTDCGWSWISNEPFGWATYHYGRWTILPGHGWVWVPGHCWAPAWVCWRQGGSHIGWAPLPPECADGMRPIWGSTVEREFGIGSDWFCFVKTRHFAGDIRRHCLARRENRALLSGTTNVTLIHERRGRIHAGGPNFDDLCRRLGRRLPQLRLDLDRVGGDRRCGVVSGDRLLVTAPTVDAAWNSLLRPGRLAGRIEPHDDPRRSHDSVREAIEKISSRRERDRGRAEEQFGSGTAGRFEVHRREQLARQREQAIAQLRDQDRKGRSTTGGRNIEVHPGAAADHGEARIGDRGSVAREERRHVPHERRETGQPPPGSGADVGLAGRVNRPGIGQAARSQERREAPDRGTRPEFGRIEPHSAGPGGVKEEAAEESGQAARSQERREAPDRGTRPEFGRIEPHSAANGDRRTGGRTSAGAAKDGRDQQAAMLRERLERVRQAQLAEQQEAERAMRRQQEEAAEQTRLAEQQEHQEKARRVAMGELQRKQEQEEATRQRREQTRQTQLAEQRRLQEEARRAELAEQQRQKEQAMAKQEGEARRVRLAEQQREQAMRQQRDEAERRAQEEAQRQTEQEAMQRKREQAALQAQEAAQRRQQEEARRQAQEEAMRRQAEQARQAQEAAQRRQQEEARRQAQEEAMRRQAEQARQAQEAAQRRQQEEARRQAQEEAMRRQAEQARQAQEAAQRRQQEEARRQAQEEAMRRQQDQARQAQEAAQRRAQEEAARRQQEGQRRGRGR